MIEAGPWTFAQRSAATVAQRQPTAVDKGKWKVYGAIARDKQKMLDVVRFSLWRNVDGSPET
jgi:hypothetical protein